MGKRSVLSKRDVDAKGRITLGASFANRTVLMEERGDEIVLRLATLILQSEAWLYESERALGSVRRGLNQARDRKFVKKGPDLKAAADLADEPRDE